MKNTTHFIAGKAANAGNLLELMLIDKTRLIVAKLQEKDITAVIELFHKDMLMEKGNAGMLIKGVSNITKAMASSDKILSATDQYHFRIVFLEERLAVLTGSNLYFKPTQDQCGEAKHLTLIWKMELDNWYLLYIHVPEVNDALPKLLFNGADGVCYAVSEQQIQYIEAQGKTSVLYLRLDGAARSSPIGSKAAQRLYGSNSITVREGIHHIKDKLTSRFIEIHRSYIANICYIMSISRYELIMAGGVRIPIPAAKYSKIKAKILNLICNNKYKI